MNELAGAAYPEVETEPPASGTAIDEIERRLDTRVPADLRALPLESDGLRGQDLLDVMWPAERIAADNADFRTDPDFAELYQPFDGLLFFGDNGGGTSSPTFRRSRRPASSSGSTRPMSAARSPRTWPTTCARS